MVANPACGQIFFKLNRENEFFPGPRLRLKVWSRETCSAVPSRASPPTLYTQAESGGYSRAPLRPPAFRDIDYDDNGVYLVVLTTSIVYQSRVYPVVQSRTSGVHCRESPPAQGQ